MSDKQFEPCTLEEATHVEIGDTTYELGNGIVTKITDRICPRIRVINESFGNDYINESSFPIFGIKALKEKKREPVEFEAVVRRSSMLMFLYLDNVPDGIPLGTKFKCVEILEEKK